MIPVSRDRNNPDGWVRRLSGFGQGVVWLILTLLILFVAVIMHGRMVGLQAPLPSQVAASNAPNKKAVNQTNSQATPTLASGRVSVFCSAGTVDLGWRELGQRPSNKSAAEDHLRVTCEGGKWKIADIARDRKVDVMTTRWETLYPDRWELKVGDEISIGESTLRIDKLAASELAWTETSSGNKGGWSHGKLVQTGSMPYSETCPRKLGMNRLKRQFHDAWTDVFGNASGESRLFAFGGQVACTEQWPLQGVTKVHAAVVSKLGDRFLLAPGKPLPGTPAAAISFHRINEAPQSFSDLYLPLESTDYGRVKRIVLGRTYYSVAWDSEKLELTPISGMDLWLSDAPAIKNNSTPKSSGDSEAIPQPRTPVVIRDPARSVLWSASQERAPRPSVVALAAPFGAAMVIGLILSFGLGRWQDGWREVSSRDWVRLASVGLAVTPALAYILSRMLGISPGLAELGYFWTLSWMLATFALWFNGKLCREDAGGVWVLTTALAAFGAVALTQLGAGAQNLRWYGFGADNMKWLTLFGSFVAVLAMLSPRLLSEAARGIAAPPQSAWHCLKNAFSGEGCAWSVIRASLIVIVLGLLVWEGIAGGEQGVGGFQPAELSKIVLVVILGYMGMQVQNERLDGRYEFRDEPIRLTLFVIVKWLFAIPILVLILFVGIGDFSPAVIILIALFVWFWQYGRLLSTIIPAHDRIYPHWRARVLGLLGLVFRRYFRVLLGFMAITAIMTILLRPEFVAMLLSGVSETKAMRFLVWAYPDAYFEEGRQVADSLRRVAEGEWQGAGLWYGINGNSIMQLPEVQNDFVGAFLLHRFGGLAGVSLVAIQALYLGLLVKLAHEVAAVGERRGRHEILAWTGLAFILHGCVALLLAHWLIAWGNVLGLLPVMGQPMTWLAAGNSHLISVGMLSAIFALICAWIVQDAQENL